MKIGVFGAGAFGTALAMTWATQHDVTLWGRSLTQGQRDIVKLPGVTLPEGLKTTSDLDTAKATDIWVLAPAMSGLTDVIQRLIPHQTPMVLCCKGFDPETHAGPVSLAQSLAPETPIALLTGPSFAVDLAAGKPTALTLACADISTGHHLQSTLSTDTLRLYSTTDVIGAELGGALKNVLAIAAGITMGAGLGPSARAALITRGFAEMQRMARVLGAQDDTLHGLSGLGDLMLTATSAESRNLRFGQALGAGDTWDSFVTVEGHKTALAMDSLAQSQGLELPITQTVAALLRNELAVSTAITRLMARPLKDE